MNYHWNWFSYTGNDRPENQDYAGIAVVPNFLFAIIADGVFSNQKSGELAKDLVHILVDRAISQEKVPSSGDVQHWIKDAFRDLKREKDPKSSTSFLAATFSRDRILHTVHAGDCRVGMLNSEGGIVWRTRVHSLANALHALPEDELRIHPARNQLTRTFGTKRLCIAETTELHCEYPGGAALVTDGFWAGLPIELQKTAFSSAWKDKEIFDDDVTRLSVQWTDYPVIRTAPAESLYVRELT